MLINDLKEVLALLRTGLPITGMTQEQWNQHIIYKAAGELADIIEDMEPQKVNFTYTVTRMKPFPKSDTQGGKPRK